MSFSDFFANAEYIRPNNGNQFPYIRKSFVLNKKIKSAKLYLSILGFGEVYINGKKITEDLYITPYSNYNAQTKKDTDIYCYADNYFNDELSYRIYVSEFDVSDFLTEGKNAFGVIVAGGWYRSSSDIYNNYRNFGDTKVCFRIVVEYNDGSKNEIVSDKTSKWKESFLVRSGIYREEQDETKEIADFSSPDFDDSSWSDVAVVDAPVSNYVKNDCPPNRIIRYITPKFVRFSKIGKIFDVGENITGFPIISCSGNKGDLIICIFSEKLDENGELDLKHGYGQKSAFYSDGRKEHFLRFTWHGFRYLELCCSAGDKFTDCLKVAVVHTDIKQSSDLKTDSETVNWLYNTYIRTQAENYQCGVPTDCPQIERKGYTGDGQLLSESGMMLFDSKALYRKWMRDISDCQDRKTGFVHYTAPCFIGCAGGPGGWSSAIINVPYNFYQFYGDKTVLERYYPQMVRYVEYIENETLDSGLIKVHKRRAYSLGDWSAPYSQKLPSEFANNCLFIDSLIKLTEIAVLLGDKDGQDRFKSLIEKYKNAVNGAYFDSESGDYCENLQGANAFALSIGLGDERTKNNLISHYNKIKKFDTGIFGTKAVVETLLRLGETETVYALLDSDDECSFNAWRKAGATTFWESWVKARSLNHPMFGGFIKCFFEYILGIRRKRAGYGEIEIKPLRFEKISYANGKITTQFGAICVMFKRNGKNTEFEITIPDGIKASFSFEGKNVMLNSGKNVFEI